MADEAKKEQPAAPAPPSSGQKPMLFIVLVVFNMLVLAGVGAMIYMSNSQKSKETTVEKIAKGEQEAQNKESQEQDFIGKTIPLETFIVNLSGAGGYKLVKVNMELEVSSDEVQEEIDKLKPKIRDIIIIILSSKYYDQVSHTDGKNALRNEIRDQVNLFLTKGQIKKVYFTDFIYQ